jgi:hypothetical protein
MIIRPHFFYLYLMNKPWVGYLSSIFLFAAGVLQFLGGKKGVGAMFVVLAICTVFLNIYMYRKPKQ